jgi:hypothetical protein
MGYRSLLLAAFLLSLPLASALEGAAEAQENHSTESVRGVLVLHWEYPHFIRQDTSEERVFEIEIRVAGWREKYLPKLTQETMLSTPLFCISGRGYENRSKLGETGRTTFVFTEIVSTIEVKAENECVRDAIID